MSGGSVFFYVQHLLGIGHLVRASRIAQALRKGGLDVTMAAGGVPVPGFPGAGVSAIALPPIMASPAFSGLQDGEGRPIDEEMKTKRRDLLLSAFDRSRADILLIEAFPFGRRQMRFELMPLVERARKRVYPPLIACSVRDILQEGRKPERLKETAKLVEEYFDLVLVHGDPKFVSLDDSFSLAHRFAGKIVYTGLVAGPPPSPLSERVDVLASVGGGAAGAELIRCAIEVAKTFPRKLRWLVLTGPNYPKADLDLMQQTATGNLRIEAFRSDFADMLGAARLSISQAGYNTVCDILQANCRAILVPFAAGGESEQTIRSMRLKEMGVAQVLAEEQLSMKRLAAAVEAGLQANRPPPHGLSLKGAEKTREILQQCVSRD